MTCAIPGYCSRSPECKDKRCEGHPINSLSLHRVSQCLICAANHYCPTHKPDPRSLYSPEECEGWARWGMWFLAAITVFCVAMVAVRYFD